MSPDIRDMLQGAAPSPVDPLDVGRVRGRAQRLRSGRRLVAAVSVMVTVGLVVTGARILPALDGNPDTPEIPIIGGSPEGDPPAPASTLSIRQRSAVVALEAVTAAGMRPSRLRTPSDSSLDYQGTSQVGDEWVSRFLRITCDEGTTRTCSGDAQLFVHVQLESDAIGGSYGEVAVTEGTLKITDVTGEATAQEKEKLVGYTAPVDGGTFRQIFDPVDVDGSTNADHLSVHASIYWTGPIPSPLETECRIEVLDASDRVIYEGPSFTADVPSAEGARDGAMATGFPRDLEWSHVRFVCQPWREKEQIPAEERIRPPAGDEEAIATGTFPDQPSMGVNAGREWKLFGSINDRYWCVRMAIPLHDDPGSNSICSPLELEQQDVIQGSMGTLIERTDGEPPSFNFLWGMVRNDVVRVKIGGIEARLIQSSDGIPASFFVGIIPAQEEVTIRGFAEDGTELGHRSIKLAHP